MRNKSLTKTITFNDFKKEILNDYRTIVISRETSLLGRKEVLNGKAKFGIFGDGKELPQIAMAKAFKKGDHRSGYYRDQTFMLALNKISVEQIFSALYANTDLNKEPMSGGRQMGSHFMSNYLDEKGDFIDSTKTYNSSADISPTSGQMPRLLGLAMASKLYRNGSFESLKFSNNGNEIAWGTIGNASTSEGPFFEVFNAAGVHQVPMIISVWDDEYGISVDNNYQTTKSSISKALQGFKRDKVNNGFEIFTVNGWDYQSLIEIYEHSSNFCRENHIPILIHVKNLTQPIGHSTSGSHERYKSKSRLSWEIEYDCNRKMRQWILENNLSDQKKIEQIESESAEFVRNQKENAWNDFQNDIVKERDSFINLIRSIVNKNKSKDLAEIANSLLRLKNIGRKDIMSSARKALRTNNNIEFFEKINNWVKDYKKSSQPLYSSNLYNESKNNFKSVKPLSATYDNSSKLVDGRLILRNNFDYLLSKYPNLIFFGEDSGKIGDVNQGLEGLQNKWSKNRVDDRGIRELSIVGEGIGLAMRGFRPIAEIQYLDYLIFALQIISDDLATMSYRTLGRQISPLIIRTRGHRLEGIWHSGSPMGMLLNSIKGVRILVPRNMTQAAGMYNTLLECLEPSLIIEPLNSYRLKEKMPSNLGQYKVPLGIIEFILRGDDVTVISYGSTLKLVEKACNELKNHNIYVDLIDLQTLIPFDISNQIILSLKKTNKLVVIDEDYGGGASAFILKKVLEDQNGYSFLDSKPKTVTAKDHRPPYGSDGDYFSKPSFDDIFEEIYSVMNEYNPINYPLKFKS
tara:strand:+ start:378 stop:2780 length:2403 start_codon:yes stop_codon:yes gene_type:complete